MKIQTLRRMMIGRTVYQKGDIVKISDKDAKEYLDKDMVVEVEEEKAKTTTNKDDKAG